MRPGLLAVLRCPYCGGRLELIEAMPHRRAGDAIEHGVLGCHCCTFPVSAGIPVLHLEPWAVAARESLEAGRPEEAERRLFAPGDEAAGARFQELARSPDATYKDLVESLGAAVEGGYFLYRFSDPTYLVTRAVVEAVAGTVLGPKGRAIDVCGGSGHLARTLATLTPEPPVVADLYFAKLWLGRRFMVPESELVCCDANSPLPFARGAFDFALCSDMFHYIWTKRQMVGELARLVDHPGSTAVVISHTHNALEWSPSFGQPLPPDGYHDLFETLEPRIYGETTLLGDVIGGGPLDLSRRQDADVVNADFALTIVASHDERVYRAHPLPKAATIEGELRVNPLYVPDPDAGADGDRVTLRLRFPSDDYAEEYSGSRRYLPEEVTVEREALDALARGELHAAVPELVRSRVVLDLPKGYY